MGDEQVQGTRILDNPGSDPMMVLPRARLVVEAGPDASREVELDGRLLVGSDAACDLVLGDDTVSKRHFEVVPTEHGYLLRDTGATNGTFVDGRRALGIYLHEGALITAGQTRLRFALEGGQREIPLSRRTNFGGLLGHSPVMRSAFAILGRAAKSHATVLVLGESGTGKELAACAIHERSDRADGPYVVFDCGAATASLVEAQLFGHERGAFTGATEARTGAFESADGGTLVLDEIGELPLELQPKLLRVLETKTVQRIGEMAPHKVDVRFVACTNRNLDEEVKAGRFRRDLFFRLSVLTVKLPPLRERKEEIPRLVAHFASNIAGEDDFDVPPPIMDMLMAHDWPGNVRELRNFVERFLAMPDAEPRMLLPGVDIEAPPERPSEAKLSLPFHEAKRRWNEQLERAYLRRLFEEHEGNVSAAARAAGLSRQSCYRLMQKHGLRS